MGYHAREPKTGDECVPPYTSLMYNDIVETMALFRRCFNQAAKAGRPLGHLVAVDEVQYLNNAVEFVLELVSFVMGQQLDPGVSDTKAAIQLIRNKVLVEGGWNVPDAWFIMDDGWMVGMIEQMAKDMETTLAEESSSGSECFRTATVRVKPTGTGKGVLFV